MAQDPAGASAPDTALTRRRVLGLSAAALTVAVPAEGLLLAPDSAAVGHEHIAPRRTTATHATVLHFLRRATYGPTPSSIAEVTARGPVAWLERQLDPASLPDPQGDAIRALYPEAGWSIRQVYRAVDAHRVDRYSWDVMLPLGQYTLALATWSSRQLFEVMVEFWSNHLNVANPSDGVWDNRQDYDKRVIRAHALGKFSSMLAASAAHPAMLSYLNQADSTTRRPERELRPRTARTAHRRSQCRLQRGHGSRLGTDHDGIHASAGRTLAPIPRVPL